MAFNKRLQEDLKANSQEGDNVKSSKEMLAYYTFKTRNFDQSVNLLTKLQIAMQQEESGYKLEDFEKITLQEYAAIKDLESVYSKSSDIMKYVYDNTDVSEFNKLFEYMNLANNLLSELPQKALATNQYKSGDLMMALTSKTTIKKGKQNLLGHEGSLEENFITKYNHAAPLYINRDNPNKRVIKQSHVVDVQRNDDLLVSTVLESSTYKIDPTKLVSKKQIKKLEQIDYGYKHDNNGEILSDQNGKPIKQTWQDVMRARYEELSYELHAGQSAHQNELESKIDEALKELTELKDKKKRADQKLTSNTGNIRLIELINKVITELQGEINTLEEKINELKIKTSGQKTNLIKNDKNRLKDAKFWINPLEGHGNWFQGNDFRDLSQKMFTGTQKEREMICSEFAGRSIGAVMDQLNRITAIDLQAAELISKEEEIIKNPIPRKENLKRLHPERLVTLLEKAGCATKIQNSFLDKIIDLEGTKKKQYKETEYTALLPKKIYSTLLNSNGKESFLKDSKRIIDIYLENCGVKKETMDKIKSDLLDKQLENIYTNHTKRPETTLQKINEMCVRVLEFCKIRTKDKYTKNNLDYFLKDIQKEIKAENPEEQKSHVGRLLEERSIGSLPTDRSRV